MNGVCLFGGCIGGNIVNQASAWKKSPLADWLAVK
jgi:hypothetical protein